MEAVSVSQQQQLAPSFTIGGVFSRSCSVIRQRFGLLFTIAAIPVLITLIVVVLGALALVATGLVAERSLTRLALAFTAIGFFWIALSTIIMGSYCYAVFHIIAGNKVSFSEVFLAVFRRIPALLGLSLVAVGIVMFLYLSVNFPIIGGFIFTAMLTVCACTFYVTVPVCMVENSSPVKSLKRSISLTKGYRFHIFGILLLSTLIYILCIIAIRVIGFGIAMILPTILDYVVTLAIDVGFGIVVTMFIYALVATTYHDLRASKEGISSEALVKVFD